MSIVPEASETGRAVAAAEPSGAAQASRTHGVARTSPIRTTSDGFTIEPLGPFSWKDALGVLGAWSPVRRFRPAGDDVVRLAFPLDGSFELVGVRLHWYGEALSGRVFGSDDLEGVGRQVARMFGLDADGRGYEAMLRRNPEIERVEGPLHGLRPVAFPSPYEAAVWAIISQRISMSQAERLQESLIGRAGTTISVDGVDVGAIPRPDVLAGLEAVDGLSQAKIDRLRAVGKAALDGRLDATRLRGLGNVEGPALLRSIPGIGPFWSAGIYLRGCNIVDAFPDEPLAVAALAAVKGIDRPLELADVDRLTAPFAPFRMWVCFLLRVAASRGLVPGIAGHERRIRSAARADRGAPAH